MKSTSHVYAALGGAFCVALSAVAAEGSDGGAATAPSGSAAAPAATAIAGAYREIEVVKPGRLSGHVSLQGSPPKPKVPPEKKPAVCTAAPVETVMVDKSGNLRNAIVYLKDITAGKKMVPGKATLEQAECAYIPHLQAVPLGTALTITNRDPVMHCAHGFIDDTMAFNYARPVKDQPMEKVLDKPGFTRIRCEIHQWMTTIVGVMPSPYFAVTTADGAFAIGDIPPGKYTLAVWHEVLGELTRSIEVLPEGQTTVDFVFNTKKGVR